MPILQKTMDYLLNLLDRPYNNRFLSIYNFLWDRMRAIRMDLRMQHIFNQEAISMLEQMVNLLNFSSFLHDLSFIYLIKSSFIMNITLKFCFYDEYD